jgi:YggT family protein
VLILLTIINVILIAYLFLISLRIVLGWFAPQALGKAWHLLVSATEPYLGLFRRIRFLRGGLFDFSPIAAVLVLVVALDLVNQLLYYGRITLGFFLASVVSAAWSGARFLLLLFVIVGILRTIPLLFRAAAASNIWRVMDMIIQPIVSWVMKLFRVRLRGTPTQHLLLTIGVIFAVWLLGEFLVIPGIRSLLQMLPI